jgi:hypothetical protein
MHERLSRQPSPKCKRDKILGASEVDEMEWQAGYVSGSLLMPLSYAKTAVGSFCETRKLFAPIVAPRVLRKRSRPDGTLPWTND